MTTVAGLFESSEQADRAVQALETAGFERDAISILAKDSTVDAEALKAATGGIPGKSSPGEVVESAGTGAVTGGAVGGLLGLLAGLGAIIIPGIGPVFAAGALASTLGLTVGASGVGAAVGGILGAMTGLSIPEEDANLYAEGVRKGAILVIVQAEEDQAQTARNVFKSHQALDPEALRDQWTRDGWERFEETQARRHEI